MRVSIGLTTQDIYSKLNVPTLSWVLSNHQILDKFVTVIVIFELAKEIYEKIRSSCHVSGWLNNDSQIEIKRLFLSCRVNLIRAVIISVGGSSSRAWILSANIGLVRQEKHYPLAESRREVAAVSVWGLRGQKTNTFVVILSNSFITRHQLLVSVGTPWQRWSLTIRCPSSTFVFSFLFRKKIKVSK